MIRPLPLRRSLTRTPKPPAVKKDQESLDLESIQKDLQKFSNEVVDIK
jgi:hypothetical protein